MAVATAAIGLLPPWAVIGVAAPLCLLALRAVQAFSAGGEIGVSVAYLTEFSPQGRRAAYTGWYLSTVAVGFACGLGATAAVAALLDPGALESWGWRVPFLLAVPARARSACICVADLRSHHTSYHRPFTTDRDPSDAVLRRPPTRPCAAASSIAGAYSAVFNIWFLFLPSYVTATGVSSLATALCCSLVGLLAVAISAPLFGRLVRRRRPAAGADRGGHGARVGRRPAVPVDARRVDHRAAGRQRDVWA